MTTMLERRSYSQTVRYPVRAQPNSGQMGVIYLLHLERPFGHARHYLGWTRRGGLDARLASHHAGSGSRLMAAVSEAGIGFVVARTWEGDRNEERRLKNLGGHTRKCPECRPGVSCDVPRYAVPPGQVVWPAA